MPRDLYRDGDHEWNATVHILAHLDSMAPCGLRPGQLLEVVDPERRAINWEAIARTFQVASSGEAVLFDCALAMWTGSQWHHELGPDGATRRPLAPLGDVVTSLSGRHLVVVLAAAGMRAGLASPAGAL